MIISGDLFVPMRGKYAGVVGEQPSVRNNWRYLIFYDDRYIQYAKAHEVYRVVDSTFKEKVIPLLHSTPAHKAFMTELVPFWYFFRVQWMGSSRAGREMYV